MEFELCFLHVGPSNRPKFMYLCSVLYVLYYINSLCSGGFVLCDCRYMLVRCVLGARHWCVTDRITRLGSATGRIFYVSLVGGGLRPSGPSSLGTGSSGRWLWQWLGGASPYDRAGPPHYAGFDTCSEFFSSCGLLDWNERLDFGSGTKEAVIPKKKVIDVRNLKNWTKFTTK